MIALIAATYREARPVLERLAARKTAESPFHAYPAPAWEEYFPDQTNCGTGYTLGVAF